jgi:hypothetical protein
MFRVPFVPQNTEWGSRGGNGEGKRGKGKGESSLIGGKGKGERGKGRNYWERIERNPNN